MSTPRVTISLNVIGLDWQKLEDEFEKTIDDGMEELRDEIERVWISKAENQLGKKADAYTNELSFERDGLTVTASLEGKAASMEEGIGRYDLKPGFLGNNLMRIIPLQKISPELGSVTGGSGMGRVQFRTVVAGSSGWWHPGFEASKISEQVKAVMESEILPTVFNPKISRIKV